MLSLLDKSSLLPLLPLLSLLFSSLILSPSSVSAVRLRREDYDEEGEGVDSDGSEDYSENAESPDEKKGDENSKPYHNVASQLEQDLFKKMQDGTPFDPKSAKRFEVYFVLHSVDHAFLDDRAGLFHLSGRFCLAWNDRRLSWSPADYDGVSMVNFNAWELWFPRFYALNNVFSNRLQSEISSMSLRIYTSRAAEGESAVVVGCPSFSMAVRCDVDASAFPDDTQTCRIVLAEHATTAEEGVQPVVFNAGNRDPEVEMSRRYDSASSSMHSVQKFHIVDFRVLNITYAVVYADSLDDENLDRVRQTPSQWPAVEITVRLARYAPYYTATVLLPSLFFASLSAVALLAGDARCSIALFALNMLFLALFLRDLVKQLPVQYDRPPRIVMFWCWQMTLSASGFFYVLLRLLLDQEAALKWQIRRLPEKIADWQPEMLSERLVSMASLFACLSGISTFILLLPPLY